jgi:curli biogenesis system outer membrane secretion channel CsgG
MKANKKFTMLAILVVLMLLVLACNTTTNTGTGTDSSAEQTPTPTAAPPTTPVENEVATFDLKPNGCDFVCVMSSWLSNNAQAIDPLAADN